MILLPTMLSTPPAKKGERLQKVLARRGLGSRRKIDQLIERGAISVNGYRAIPGVRVQMGDKVTIEGRVIEVRGASPSQVIALHKPRGFVVSRNAQSGQCSVFDLLPKDFGLEWVAVGRLDIDTSGLLFITNDGEMAHALMHPSNEVPRVYRVLVKGRVSCAMLKQMLIGVKSGQRLLQFDSIKAEQTVDDEKQWFEVRLHQGRNREVRRLWASQEADVCRLIRTAYGSQKLDVASGCWRTLTPEEQKKLFNGESRHKKERHPSEKMKEKLSLSQ